MLIHKLSAAKYSIFRNIHSGTPSPDPIYKVEVHNAKQYQHDEVEDAQGWRTSR